MTIRVEELMAREVVSLQSSDSVEMARDAMSTHDIHALPVVNAANKPMGIVTSSDLMAGHPGSDAIGSLMTEKVHTVSRETPIDDVARKMLAQRLHHIVVVENEKVVGILSTFDFLRLITEERFRVELAGG